MEALSGNGVGGRVVGEGDGVLVGVGVSGGLVGVGVSVGVGSKVLVGEACICWVAVARSDASP